MTVENEAFIDIEQMLHKRVDRLWKKQWVSLEGEINKAANAGEWDRAFQLCDEIDFTDVVAKSRRLARTLAEASLFLGASRIVEPESATFMGAPDENLLDRAVEQWAIVLERNAQEALRIQAKNLVAELEMERQEANMIIKADLGKVGNAGTQYSQATASLMISRLSTMGFMLEAKARGVKRYRVNEVMDAATCPVCATMHNKHFDVDDGWNNISSQMMGADPESIKATNPFPSQSKQNVKGLRNMGERQLVRQGLNLPPYHPNCRGVVSLEDTTMQDPAIVQGLAQGERMIDSGDLTPDQVAARMFGNFDDIDDAFLAAALGAGAGAEFATDGD